MQTSKKKVTRLHRGQLQQAWPVIGGVSPCSWRAMQVQVCVEAVKAHDCVVTALKKKKKKKKKKKTDANISLV